VRLVETPYAILKVPALQRQALHDFEDVAVRSTSTGAGQIAYRLPDLEFVVAHSLLDRLQLSPYHDGTLTGVRVRVAYLRGRPAPVPNDHFMPTTPSAADTALSDVRHGIVRLGTAGRGSPFGRVWWVAQANDGSRI
jgi:hypothetical protein